MPFHNFAAHFHQLFCRILGKILQQVESLRKHKIDYDRYDSAGYHKYGHEKHVNRVLRITEVKGIKYCHRYLADGTDQTQYKLD